MKKLIFKGFMGTICLLVISALLVFAIMWLWNWIVPGITGWKEITFWQVLGLYVIYRLFLAEISIVMNYDPKTDFISISELISTNKNNKTTAYKVIKVGNLEIKIQKHTIADTDSH